MDPLNMDDPLLRAAIEDSLRESQHRGSQSQSQASSQRAQSTVVDLTNDSDDDSDVKEVFPKSKSVVGSDTDNEAADDDDDDLKRALALSLEGVSHDAGPAPAALQKPQESPQLPGILGLDRKQMEQERLARMAKRKADDSSPLDQTPAKAARKETGQPSQTANGVPIARASSSWAVPTTDICDQLAANDPNCKVKPTTRPVPQWHLGAVKKTHVSGTQRKGNEITIEEVLQRGDLELAVLSSFLWDMEWLFRKLDTDRTRFILVMHAKEEATRRQYQRETEEMRNLRLCFPPMEGNVNCMHSKLMLLFHPDYLRIAVPTANLTATDWGENKLMENTVFIIDLPKKKSQESATKDTTEESTEGSKTPFYEELVYYLEATKLHRNVIKKLDDFDFSKTARYVFVHTVGGSHKEESSWKRTGYCGLGRAVTNLGLRSVAPIEVDYVTSSVGSITNEFFRAIYLACKGDDGLAEYTLRKEPNPSLVQAEDPNRTMMLNASTNWNGRFRVYFPSEKTVRAAHSNPEMTAGTVCFQEKWWKENKYPRSAMKDCESERGVLMHNKLIFVWPLKPIPLRDNTHCTGWVYVGSANFSESAWGRLVQNRQTRQPSLNCRNWECGVIVPITCAELPSEKRKDPNAPRPPIRERLTAMHEEDEKKGLLPVKTFRDTVPVPMKVPAVQLSDEQPGDRRPWFFGGPHMKFRVGNQVP